MTLLRNHKITWLEIDDCSNTFDPDLNHDLQLISENKTVINKESPCRVSVIII